MLETIDGLRRAGAFTLSADGEPSTPAARRSRPWSRSRLRSPRLRITAPIDALVAGPADLVRRHLRVAVCALVATALSSLVLLIVALANFPSEGEIVWPVVFAVVLIEVAGHELAHAAACRLVGVRIREAGIMLWAWLVPVVYVDCTDVYRLASRRARLAVALAGPFVDLLAAGCSAAVVLLASGPRVSGTAFTIFLSEAAVLARNLAPLPPADGYHALSAATDELNLSGRSRRHLLGCVTALSRHAVGGGRPVAVDTPEATPRTRREWMYVAYGALVVVYTLALLSLVPIEVRAVLNALGR